MARRTFTPAAHALQGEQSQPSLFRSPPHSSLKHDEPAPGGHDFSRVPIHSESPERGLAHLGISGPGQRLPHLETLQRAFGHHRLDGIEAFQGPRAATAARQLNAQAFAHGERIVFSQPPDLRSAAHEAAHVVQQRQGVAAKGRYGEPAYEPVADAVAERVASGGHAEGLLDSPAKLGGSHAVFQLQGAPPGSSVQDAMDGKTKWTQALAEQAMGAYQVLADADRDAWVARHTTIQQMLGALSPNDTLAGRKFSDLISDILHRVQKRNAIAFSQRLGLAGEAGMASTQSTFMHQKNVAAAQKAAPKGKAPTAADIAAQQSAQVAATSIPSQTVTMTPQQANQINTDINSRVPALITYATAKHPELKLTAGQIKADALAVHDRGEDIIAFAEGGKAVVGEAFLKLIKLDFAYVIPTIVHELYGHPEYGSYGSAEYNLEIYDKAAAKMPGYTKPTGDDRLKEVDAYAYQETEIYSLLREVDYFTPTAAAHQAVSNLNYEPGPAIASRIGLIKQQFERRVALSLIRGLATRIHADPRLSAKAKKVFDQGVKQQFPAEAALLVK